MKRCYTKAVLYSQLVWYKLVGQLVTGKEQGWQYGTIRSEFAYYVPRTLNRTSVPYFSSIFEAYPRLYIKDVPYQRTNLPNKN